MRKGIWSIFLVVAAIGLVGARPAAAFDVNATSWLVAHPGSDTILMSHNAEKEIPPASLAKMMTLYLLFEAIENGVVTEESLLPISEKAWKKGGSKMFLEVGKKVRVDDLIHGIAVASGNDACIVVAEFLGGSEEAFAEMMNRKARELGMERTVFQNASGWPHPAQHTTAHDMYRLARALRMNFPQYYDVFSETEFTYNGIRQFNRNGLLNDGIGVDGLKTGHVEEAGYHLASSAGRGDTRLTAVVMGADSMKARERETAKLFSYVFAQYDTFALFKEGQTVEKAPVWMGEVETVPLVAGSGLSLYLPRAKRKGLSAEISYTSPLRAPLQPGQQVGVIRVASDGMEREVPLLVAQPVAEKGFFGRIGAAMRHNLGLTR